MATSKLAMQEIPTNNCRFLRLADNTQYNPAEVVTDTILDITPPGFSCPVSFHVDKMFNSVFNSSVLKLAPATTYTDLVPLSDGIYKIKFTSVTGTTSQYVEYELFRNCQLTQIYMKAICNLFSEQCELLHEDFEAQRKKLIWIKELIDASKYMAEECGDNQKAIELYNEAGRLLNKINDCGCI